MSQFEKRLNNEKVTKSVGELAVLGGDLVEESEELVFVDLAVTVGVHSGEGFFESVLIEGVSLSESAVGVNEGSVSLGLVKVTIGVNVVLGEQVVDKCGELFLSCLAFHKIF